MGELIELIDTSRQVGDGWKRNDATDELGLFDRDREANADSGDPQELLDFTTVSSTFYPMLSAYYKDRANAWLAGAKARFEAGG